MLCSPLRFMWFFVCDVASGTATYYTVELLAHTIYAGSYHIPYSNLYNAKMCFLQIMVTFLSYFSNACHSCLGVAERLKHTVELRRYECT